MGKFDPDMSLRAAFLLLCERALIWDMGAQRSTSLAVLFSVCAA